MLARKDIGHALIRDQGQLLAIFVMDGKKLVMALGLFTDFAWQVLHGNGFDIDHALGRCAKIIWCLHPLTLS